MRFCGQKPAYFFERVFSASAKVLFGILSGESDLAAARAFENPTFTARRYAITLYGAEKGVKSVGKTFCKGEKRAGRRNALYGKLRGLKRLARRCVSTGRRV